MADTPVPELRNNVSQVLRRVEAGVLATPELALRSRRLATLQHAQSLSPLTIDDTVAMKWAELRVRLFDAGGSMPVNGSSTKLDRGHSTGGGCARRDPGRGLRRISCPLCDI